MEFQIVSMMILAVFYGCYFVKMIRQHQKGIRTDQMGRGKTGIVKRIEITLKIATCLVPVVEVICIVRNIYNFVIPVRIVGACTGIAGVIIFVISILTMRDSWRAGVSRDEKTELVTDGIYRISRNPAFLGFDLVYMGILIMFFNWILFFVTCFAVLMLHLQIVNVEEEFLMNVFGEKYINYSKKVCRYLGRKK